MRTLVMLLALPLAGCGGGSSGGGGPALPHIGVPPLVVNAPDSFDMVQLVSVQNGTFDYDWECSRGQANLAIAGFTGGSIRIEIEDGDGTVVHDNTYTGGLAGAISTMTAPGGAPGTWLLRFTFQGVLSVGAIDISADVFNEPDAVVIGGSFALQVSYEYEAGWPAGPAHVVIGTAISAGVVRIRIWDGEGDLVIDRTNLATFIGSFDGDSLPGAAGTWRIRIDINAVATAGAITIDHP